jgi:hypothetical protein
MPALFGVAIVGRSEGMIPGGIVGLSLLLAVAVDAGGLSSSGVPAFTGPLSFQQRNAAMRPLVRSATDCIVSAVSADPRLRESLKSGALGDLIVDSMAPCLIPVRAMIDGYDLHFGDGSGQAFFMGPYLDALPATVSRQVEGTPAE